jgi:hypothetical protein
VVEVKTYLALVVVTWVDDSVVEGIDVVVVRKGGVVHEREAADVNVEINTVGVVVEVTNVVDGTIDVVTGHRVGVVVDTIGVVTGRFDVVTGAVVGLVFTCTVAKTVERNCTCTGREVGGVFT